MSQAYDTNGAIKITGAAGGGGADGINRISAGTQIAGTSTTVVFSNSNNVSFGMSASSIVTASASFAQSTQPVAASAANGSALFSTLSFSNANGITFSTGAGPAIIGSVATTYRASNDAVGLNTAQSNVTWTVNSAGLSLDARGYAGTGTSATNASITLDSNGLAISVAAPGGGGFQSAGFSTQGNTSGDTGFASQSIQLVGGNNITLSGSTGAGAITITISGPNAGGAQTGISGIQVSDNTYTSGTVTWRNANGISFGSSGANGISASYTVPTVTNSSWTVSDAATSGTVGRLAFTNLNGVTLSLSTGAAGSHTIVGSHNGLTSQSNQAWSGSNASSTFQTLSFNNANGVSWSNNAGAVEASYTRPVVSNAIQSVGSATNSGTNTSRFAADDHVHAGVFSMGVTNAGNSVGDTRVDVGRFVLQGGNSITLSQITAANALNTIIFSGPNALTSQSNQAFSAAGGSSAFQTLGFSDGNGVSFTNTNGSVGATVRTNYASSVHGHTMTASAQSNTTQSSSGTLDMGGFNVAGAGAISVGISNNSIVISGPSGGGETRLTAYAQSNTTQSSSGTIALSSLNFHGAGIASVGVSNGSVIVSVPSGGGAGDGGVFAGVSTDGNTAGSTGTVSTGNFVLVGSNGITLSQSTGAAGSAATVSMFGYRPVTYSGCQPFRDQFMNTLGTSQGTLSVYPATIHNCQFDRIGFFVSASNATNSSGSHTLTFGWGIYTKNDSTLSAITTLSTSVAITASGTAGSYSRYSGLRMITIPWTSTLTEGNYWMAMFSRSTSGGANASYSLLAMSNGLRTYAGLINAAANNSLQASLGQGIYATSTTANRDSIAFSNLIGSSTGANRFPIVNFYSGTI